MKSSILDTICSPQDVKELPFEQLDVLCTQIRERLIQTTAKTGGHLASNLGTVELTVALHRVFDCPDDQIVWDVGHQCYTHKLLTGRREQFSTLRQEGGLSGFPKRKESEYDAFIAGHSSTSISVASGLARAKKLQNDQHHVIAVIGDGAFTSGLAFEGANNAARFGDNLIVILNDNKMSISKNVGAMSEYLYQLRTGETYNKIKNDIEGWLKNMEFGSDVLKAIRRLKGSVKYLMVPTSIFEELGFTYLGPVDGHDLEGLLDVLQAAKKIDGPVMVHVLTKKGKGYKPAEESPNKFHGTGPFDIATGKKITNPNAPVSYTEVFGKTLSKLADIDDKIVGITAAMPDGTGLNIFAEAHKDHFFDVGIAEQHAVTAAAGMAAAGMKPVAAIYSTFMQRAYDSIMHDICMQKLHVTLCLDRAGLVGDDGYTHHGVFDYAYLRSIPNMTIMAPKDENELQHMLKTALDFDGPVSVRYPRGSGVGVALDTQWQDLPIGKAEVLRTGKDVCFWAIGSMVQTALDAAELLEAQGISAGVVNMRFAKPLDVELLREHAQSYGKIITLEEGVLAGGVGSAILEELNENKLLEQCEVRCFGIPDEFVMHGDKKLLFRDLGLDTPTIAAKAAAFVKGEEE